MHARIAWLSDDCLSQYGQSWLQIFLDFCRFSYILANTHRFLQILSDSCRPYQILVDSIKFLQILPNSSRFYQILADSIRFLQILANTHRFFQIDVDSIRLIWILPDFHRFSYSCRLSYNLIINSHDRFLQIIKDACKFSYTKVSHMTYFIIYCQKFDQASLAKVKFWQ